MKRFWSDTNGASAVEFAIVAGPLLLLVFGTIEFGRLYWTQNALQQAAITGARCAGIGQADCASGGVRNVDRTKAFVASIAGGWLVPLKAAEVTVDFETSCSGLAGFSQIEVRHDFSTPLPVLLTALADGMTLVASACFPRAAS